MAVYTHVSAEALSDFLRRYDLGTLVSAKGIAEGVENTNYMVDTDAGRYFLTLYEKRVDEGDLPYFLGLLDHLAASGLPVPRALPDRSGVAIQQLNDRPACLIEFLPGVSVSHPTPEQAFAAAAMLGRMHQAVADFDRVRPNALGVESWQPLLDRCGRDLDSIEPGLFDRVSAALSDVVAHWPADLPVSTIHADLFPDNVLMLGDAVSGLIDFYFACTDTRAYDLAILHGSWSFDADGRVLDKGVSRAVVDGYCSTFQLSDAERAALPVLARGSCIRFLLTRAWDWINTPADALVTRKDPLAYLRRLEAYEAGGIFA